MKKTITLLFSAATLIVVLTSGVKSSNGKSGRTGAPGESTCSSCHTSSSGLGSIALHSDIPVAGYTAGTTYHIKVVLKYTGRSTWGFDVEALNSSNTNIGTLVVTDATYSKTGSSGGRTNIEQKTPYTTADSAVLMFNWIAPVTGSGAATFYFAGIAANGNGNDGSGDYTYNGNASFSEFIQPTGIENVNGVLDVAVYPNPVENELSITGNNLAENTIQVFGANGALVKQSVLVNNQKLNMTELNAGIYFVKITAGNKMVVKKIVKQ